MSGANFFLLICPKSQNNIFKITNLKQDCQKLRSQIVQDPEKLKKVGYPNQLFLLCYVKELCSLSWLPLQTISDMEDQAEMEKKTTSDLDVKARGWTPSMPSKLLIAGLKTKSSFSAELTARLGCLKKLEESILKCIAIMNECAAEVTIAFLSGCVVLTLTALTISE